MICDICGQKGAGTRHITRSYGKGNLQDFKDILSRSTIMTARARPLKYVFLWQKTRLPNKSQGKSRVKFRNS